MPAMTIEKNQCYRRLMGTLAYIVQAAPRKEVRERNACAQIDCSPKLPLWRGSVHRDSSWHTRP